MKFSVSLIFAFSMATSLMASPFAALEGELPEIGREQATGGGSLVYYGAPSTHPRSAAPAGDRDEVFRESGANGGTLVYYGASKIRRSLVSPLKRWCFFNCSKNTCPATATPGCSSSHAAPDDVCTDLVADLEGYGDVEVPGSPRQICRFPPQGKPCCVSWGTKVKESNGQKLKKSDLYLNANLIVKTCTQNGVSGRIARVKLVDTCTAFCVSGRGTHC